MVAADLSQFRRFGFPVFEVFDQRSKLCLQGLKALQAFATVEVFKPQKLFNRLGCMGWVQLGYQASDSSRV